MMEDRKKGMENSGWRRLNTLSRHFLMRYEPNQVLHLTCLSISDDSKPVDSEPVVIGGMVLDIHATPATSAGPRTTVPGKIHYVNGGVARNIAESMSKMGTKPFMISVVGLDMAGNLLLDYWKSAGLATEGIQRCRDIGSPVVCNLFDINGEVEAGVASVEAIEIFLSPEWIQQFRLNICSAPVLMVDANLNPHSLLSCCQMAAESGIPVWYEPVSVVKSRRVASIVKYVTFASPNEDELVAMANALSSGNGFSPVKRVTRDESRLSIDCLFEMLKPAIKVLLEKGVKILIVTLGADGVFVCCKDGPGILKDHFKITKPSFYGKQLHEIVSLSCPSNKFGTAVRFERTVPHLYVAHFPSLPASVVRLTGAGDCLVGGTLSSLCAGLDVMQSVAVGVAAAKAAVEVKTNVPSEFHLCKIADDAKLIHNSATVVCNQPFL